MDMGVMCVFLFLYIYLSVKYSWLIYFLKEFSEYSEVVSLWETFTIYSVFSKYM